MYLIQKVIKEIPSKTQLMKQRSCFKIAHVSDCAFIHLFIFLTLELSIKKRVIFVRGKYPTLLSD